MGRLLFWGFGIIAVVVIGVLFSDDIQSPSSGSPADSKLERDSESNTVSRVYETVAGNPSVIWTHPPSFVGNRLTMAGTLDSVVPTDELAVILFHQPSDSQDEWCGIAGKPWLKLVEPPPPNSRYRTSTTSMWCEVIYWTPDNRVSGKESFREEKGSRAVEVSFPFRAADTWTIRGKTFNIRANLPQSNRLGIDSVALWAGPEQLAVYVVDRHQSGGDAP